MFLIMDATKNDLKLKQRREYMRRYMRLRRINGNDYYEKHKKRLNEKVKCEFCDKCIGRQNLKRHIKTQHRT
mgnify:FL=1